MSATPDVLDRLRALEDENRRLVAMLDALPDHVLLLDREFRLRFLNLACAEVAAVTVGMPGRPRDQLIGVAAVDRMEPEAVRESFRRLFTRARDGETIREEFMLRTADGSRWHEQHVVPVRNAADEVEAIAVASRDIQARKEAEARLQLLSKVGLLAETTDYDNVLTRAANLAIPELADWVVLDLVVDGHIEPGRIAHPDPVRAAGAEQLRRAQDASPCGALDAEPRAEIQRIDETDAAALRARDPGLYQVLRELGATTAMVVPFVVLGATIAIATFAYGEESGRRHRSEDLALAEEIARRAAQIVENARLHADLAQSLEFRERVMGVLGHDLRNPLTAVLSLSATLGQRPDLPDRAREGLRHVRSSAERMEQMIRTILDFTQLRFRGAPTLAPESFDLAALVRAIVEELRAALPERTITVTARGELRGRWDHTRLGQVISNLVGNALEHGARESPVEVEVAGDAGTVAIAVTNRGPTIPASALGKLFEPFWQGPGDAGSKPRGLGLGLYIAHQIVAAHGGTIEVRSADDETTLTVRLPV